MEKLFSPGNTTTHLGTFERVDQTAFAEVGEANDADGDAGFMEWCSVMNLAADYETIGGVLLWL
jgi:hypothetical protein